MTRDTESVLSQGRLEVSKEEFDLLVGGAASRNPHVVLEAIAKGGQQIDIWEVFSKKEDEEVDGPLILNYKAAKVFLRNEKKAGTNKDELREAFMDTTGPGFLAFAPTDDEAHTHQRLRRDVTRSMSGPAIEGYVDGPFAELGQTFVADWREKIREAGGELDIVVREMLEDLYLQAIFRAVAREHQLTLPQMKLVEQAFMARTMAFAAEKRKLPEEVVLKAKTAADALATQLSEMLYGLNNEYVTKVIEGALSDDDSKTFDFMHEMARRQAHATGQEKEDLAERTRDLSLSLVMGGRETTAFVTTALWFEVANHPEIEAKLLAEWDRVLGGRVPTSEDIPKLEYTNRVIKEALRLHSPFHTGLRTTQKDITIGNQEIKAGREVVFSSRQFHMDPTVFENPEEFNPDRWLEPDPEKLALMEEHFMPFSEGARKCIGDRFAEKVIAQMLPLLIGAFELDAKELKKVVYPAGAIYMFPDGVPGKLRERGVSPQAPTAA